MLETRTPATTNAIGHIHPRARTYSANRAACAPNATDDFADTTHGTTGNSGRASRSATAGTVFDNHMRIVPLIPNDEIPARRAAR